MTMNQMHQDIIEAKVKLLLAIIGLDDDYLESMRVKFPDPYLYYSDEATKFLKEQFNNKVNNNGINTTTDR